jgi:hypothetical protein
MFSAGGTCWLGKLRSARLDAADGAVKEVARIVKQILERWPHVRILLRADSGFAREELMAWCETNRAHFLFGLAQNSRLLADIESELGRGEEPDQGVSTRPLCRSHLDRHDACQPVAAMVYFDGLRPSLRVASDLAASHSVFKGVMR